MERIRIKPRANWESIVEEQGMTFHTLDGKPYWHESAYYRFSAKEIDLIDDCANELHSMCMEAVDHVIKNDMFKRLRIPEAAVSYIVKSRERGEFSLYGRFDLAYDGHMGNPKMLEYNADTPTSLLEASVIQWFWLKDNFKEADQFNSIHERLIEAWKTQDFKTVHFACVKDNLEDAQTVFYLQDTCHQAGMRQKHIYIDEIGWDSASSHFADMDDEKLEALFKLYPWEWMWNEGFGQHILKDSCRFIEPAWKMILSNKGILPVLWELFPKHPNLLPAYFEDEIKTMPSSYVRKPVFGREGANVRLVRYGETELDASGSYGAEGYVIQECVKLPDYDSYHPVLGAWIVGGESAGMGIREDKTLITGNGSIFTPHMFR